MVIRSYMMEAVRMKRSVSLLLSLFAVALFCLIIVGGASPVLADDLTTASVSGKYSTLLMTLYVPQDQGSYGNFNDYGFYTSTSYAGYTNVPAGYWVYVYPNWYIWKDVAAGGGTNITKASVNGKYYNLLKVINVPQDKGSYGDFDDYGYYSSTSYAGYTNVPAGYWVYVYPDWYIWGNQR
jgi:hypothetical protein